MRRNFHTLAAIASIGSAMFWVMPIALKGIENLTKAYAKADADLGVLVGNPQKSEPAASAVVTDAPRDLSSHAVRRLILQRYKETAQP